jgi:urea transport system ATP-binding protein
MLEVEGLYAFYKETPALVDVSIRLGDGEIVSVLGRNGVGKTTLLKSLVGLLPAKKGVVRFQGKDITRMKPYQRARLGLAYVPQGREIFPKLSVIENLIMGSELNEQRRMVLIDQVFDYFPILKDRVKQMGGTLSGGEQQMLAIGRAIVGNPKLVLLDEPTEGIQPLIVQEICRKIRQINAEMGTGFVLVEQNLQFVSFLTNRVYLMEKGSVAEEVVSDDVMNNEIVQNYLVV